MRSHLIEYLSCDNNIPAEELITDEEIIEVVLEENDEQDEREESKRKRRRRFRALESKHLDCKQKKKC